MRVCRPSRYIPGCSLFVFTLLSLSLRATQAAPTIDNSLVRSNATGLTIEQYRQQRAELIADERGFRFDAHRIRNATAQELKAAEIVDALRQLEQREVWYADGSKEPGMPFLYAKDTIVQTQLYQLIKKMPKGGLLHAHLDAMCDTSYLLELALEYPRIHIRTASGLKSSTAFPLPSFAPLADELMEKSAHNSIMTSPNYVPNSWVPLQRARNEFPSELGGIGGFDRWIIGSLTVNAHDAYVEHNTTAKIWAKFRTTFHVALGIVRYEPILKRYTEQLLVSQIEDGISYVEIRIGLSNTRGVISEDGSRTISNSQVLSITQSAIDNVEARMMQEGREDEFVGARIIYKATRSDPKEDMVWCLNDCLELKAEYPDLLAGFDAAGYEDVGHSLIYFAESFLNFRAEAEKRGLDIPFLFHAGETLDDGSEVDSNLYDALLLGAKRIGHGYSLAKHPLLMQKFKERGIAVEVCPISNEILKLVGSIAMHPLPILLNYGVPVVIASDDPAAFGNVGLSFDFYQVMVASKITNLLSLGQLARQSLEYSTLDSVKKARALELWEGRWAKFIDNIVVGGMNQYSPEKQSLVENRQPARGEWAGSIDSGVTFN